MWMLALIVLVTLGAGSASADILEWRDASGVTHYTNLKEDVPAEQRDSVHVVVNELVHHPSVAATASAAAAKAEPPHQAQVIYDRSSLLSEAYVDGLVRGLQAARATGAAGGSVQINGPLAVASAPAAAGGAYWPPYSPPLLTTSFDRGRSRHLTLRLLLQDQFAIDREGPYVYAERLGPPFGHVPLSVDLNPLLANGLPHGFPRLIRVITR
jgi:hypothetical protein